MEKFHHGITEAIQQLQEETDQQFTVLMRNGGMSIEYYAPEKIDTQTPHRQDEIYVIAAGNGTFYRDGERVPFQTGAVLFVPAGMEHRFENFSENFATGIK